MSFSKAFWKKIAYDIETQYQHGHPSDWDQESISTFLEDVEDKLKKEFEQEFEKAKRCGVPFVKGRYAIEQWKPIDTSTFRRIFQYQTSTGRDHTKSQFAIYLGYPSFQNYINNNLTSTAEQKIHNGGQKSSKPENENRKLRWTVLSFFVMLLLGIIIVKIIIGKKAEKSLISDYATEMLNVSKLPPSQVIKCKKALVALKRIEDGALIHQDLFREALRGFEFSDEAKASKEEAERLMNYLGVKYADYYSFPDTVSVPYLTGNLSTKIVVTIWIGSFDNSKVYGLRYKNPAEQASPENHIFIDKASL